MNEFETFVVSVGIALLILSAPLLIVVFAAWLFSPKQAETANTDHDDNPNRYLEYWQRQEDGTLLMRLADCGEIRGDCCYWRYYPSGNRCPDELGSIADAIWKQIEWQVPEVMKKEMKKPFDMCGEPDGSPCTEEAKEGSVNAYLVVACHIDPPQEHILGVFNSLEKARNAVKEAEKRMPWKEYQLDVFAYELNQVNSYYMMV